MIPVKTFVKMNQDQILETENAMMMEQPITIMTFRKRVEDETDKQLQGDARRVVKTLVNVNFGHMIRRINGVT